MREVGSDRWPVEGLEPGVRWAALLDQVDLFDAGLFRISPHEAVAMDPAQRILLEVAWSALEDTARAPDSLAGSRAGVFVGVAASEYYPRLVASDHPAGRDAYAATGNVASVAAGRIAYLFGLAGPAVSIDTACSSSLVAGTSPARACGPGSATSRSPAGRTSSSRAR